MKAALLEECVRPLSGCADRATQSLRDDNRRTIGRVAGGEQICGWPGTNKPCLGSGDGSYLVVSDGGNGELQDLIFKMKRCGTFGLEKLDRFNADV
jgi:hypothetical protein